jgi:hypothetical protein
MDRLGPRDFHLIEYFTRSDLDRHPVWRHFDEVHDRAQVLEWGVAAERIDAEVEKFRFCGTEPLYPVLELDPLPSIDDLTIRVAYVLSSGKQLDGYAIDPSVYGVFEGDRQFIFNRNLASAAARQADGLAAALGTDTKALFPLHYESEWVRADGSRVEGAVECFW